MQKVLSALLFAFSAIAAVSAQNGPILTAGQKFDGRINGGQRIIHTVELKKGEFLRAELFDGMGDNAFELRDAKGKTLVESNFSGHFNTEPISYAATETGVYQLVVSAQPFEPTFDYSIVTTIKPLPGAEDLKRLSAEQALRDINQALAAEQHDNIRRAIESAQEVAETWKALGDEGWEAYTLNGIGLGFRKLGELEKAQEFYSKALAIRQSIKDVRGEAISQLNLARIVLAKRELEEAVELMRRVAALYRSSGNSHEEAGTLSEIGNAFRDSWKPQNALAEYHKATAIARDAGLDALEASILTDFADALYQLNQTAALVEKRQRAALLYERLGDRESQAEQFFQIGRAYLEENAFTQAETYLNRARSLYGADNASAAYAHWLLGRLHRYIQKPELAYKHFEKAAAVNDADRDPAASAGPLEESGRLYRDSGELSTALAQFAKALTFRQKENDRAKLGRLYSDIGLVERAAGNTEGARNAFRNALIHLMTGDDGRPLGIEAATLLVDRTLADQRPTAIEFKEGMPLVQGAHFTRTVRKGDRKHEYQLTIEKGHFLHIELDQHAIDIVTRLVDKNGVEVARADRNTGDEGYESLYFQATETGAFTIRIEPQEAGTVGNYDLWIQSLQPATDDDRTRFEAEKLWSEGVELFATVVKKLERSPRDRSAVRSDAQSAVQKFLSARDKFRKIGDAGGQEIAIGAAFRVKETVGDNLDDLAFEIVTLVRLLGDHESEANWLRSHLNRVSTGWDKELSIELANELVFVTDPKYATHPFSPQQRAKALQLAGAAYSGAGKQQSSIVLYNKALPIYVDARDEKGQAEILDNIGRSLSGADPSSAMVQWEKAAEIYTRLSEFAKASEIYGNICAVLVSDGRAFESKRFCEKAIREKRNADPNDTLSSFLEWRLGQANWVQGDLTQALKFFESGARSAGNHYRPYNLYGMGKVYRSLGDLIMAREYFEKAKAEISLMPTHSEIGELLSDLGEIHARTGEVKKAIVENEAALSHLRKTNIYYLNLSFQEAEIVTKIADLHLQAGEVEKATAKLKEAEGFLKDGARRSALFFRVKAALHQKQGRPSEAVSDYHSALSIYREERNPEGEAATLADLMRSHSRSGNRALGIFYGKAAANVLFMLRTNVRSMDSQTRRNFVRSLQDIYRDLAGNLIQSERLDEAIEVLNAFKDQRMFDLDESRSLKEKPLSNTPAEAAALKRYQAIFSQKDDYVKSDAAFSGLMKSIEQGFGIAVGRSDKVGEIGDVKALQTALANITDRTGNGPVAIYQLVGDEALTSIVVSSAAVRSVTVPIKAKELNEKALKVQQLLQSSRYNPEQAANDLYEIVFKPVERLLPANVDTVLWSMDGSLRYVPMAALFDGDRYLVQRYRHVVFTRADMTAMTEVVSPKWQASGFGTVEAHTVDLLGDRIAFAKLTGVKDELAALFTRDGKNPAILSGSVRPDKQFNRKQMLADLRVRRPVVHIASHFNFRPGDDARSFLLMGDGTPFTLFEMKQERDMFAGVDLLTLSACNTAAQQPGADGREIDGFAELAQRLGARSVMATLWPVADASTPWLMKEFYRNKIKGKLSKAEALRRAQLALLEGQESPELKRIALSQGSRKGAAALVTSQNEVARGDMFVTESESPLHKPDPRRPFAHPYYWAAFILFGNWQ